MSDQPTNRGRPVSVPTRLEIKRLRNIEGLTVAAVARQVGVSRPTVYRYAKPTADEKSSE